MIGITEFDCISKYNHFEKHKTYKFIFTTHMVPLSPGVKNQSEFSAEAWENYGSEMMVPGSHFYDEKSLMFATPPPGIQVCNWVLLIYFFESIHNV